MNEEFENAVDALVNLGYAGITAQVYRMADELNETHKQATGFLAHGMSKFDPHRLNKLEGASKGDVWAFDAMKYGAIELQKMHPFLSNETAIWTSGALSGENARPSKSGPQPNIGKQYLKLLVHLMVERAVEFGLTRSRHNTTRKETSAYDAVLVALAREGLNLSFDQVSGFDKAAAKDPAQENLKRFFPTEEF